MTKLKKLIGVEYIAIADVIVGERLRKDSTRVRAKIEDIAASIKDIGPLQPIILDDKNNLIDGGCRYEAYKHLGQDEIPFVRRLRVTPAKKFAMEVEANMQRSDLTWQEKVTAIGKTHDMKEKEAEDAGEQWGQRATGHMLGINVASINNAIQIWKCLKKGDKEIESCEHLGAAIMLLAERKKKEAVNFRLATSPDVPKPDGTKVTRPVIFVLGRPKDGPVEPPVIANSAPKESNRHIDLSSFLFNDDCISWMHRAPKDSVDTIITDIPYGVDLNNMEDIGNIDMMRSTHEVADNLALMPEFLKAAWHILRPNSYLMFFYALQHHEKLRDWGAEVGFSVQDWPLLWLKPHSCKNNAPQCNYTKSFEPVMVMRKGSPVLVKPMTKCHLEVDGMPDKKQQSNPFAKPLEFLTEMVFKPMGLKQGSICLDPFAGEGSILSAALLNGLQPIGIEIDADRFPSLVSRIQRLYKNVLNNAAEFTFPEMKS